MLKEIIDAGLTVLNLVQLANNNLRDEKKPEERQKAIKANRQISNIRNAAYVIRRIVK